MFEAICVKKFVLAERYDVYIRRLPIRKSFATNVSAYVMTRTSFPAERLVNSNFALFCIGVFLFDGVFATHMYRPSRRSYV